MPDPGIYDFDAIKGYMEKIRKEEGEAMGVNIEPYQKPFSDPIDGHTPPPPPSSPPAQPDEYYC